ncbi:amylo-alpha-1,6-glucosidase [Chitinophaga vietnamensis]|uniref:amylo-alpha-1,6-glucosidase n=1 Tax=Chitinophaga vietnamensis TaxID=2593957 RepID=UPI001177BC8E|nr:amylo-alpha-1,6-glucosidase [Chitinophaga vietnamensis]
MPAPYKIQTHFDGAFMNNLAAATGREYLLTGAQGTYTASTICGCNTRKYHGLFVAPQPQIDGDAHVLLSALDETVISEDGIWELGMHCYPGVYYPQGYQYIREFATQPVLRWKYQAGAVNLDKELLLDHKTDRLLIRYTVTAAPGPFTLRLLPLLAFRNMHTTGKANSCINGDILSMPDGISVRLYDAYLPLYLQLFSNAAFVPSPAWYFNAEYPVERERGYEFQEDLYTPGYFEVGLQAGQSVIFSAGLKAAQTADVSAFDPQPDLRQAPASLDAYLRRAARQFIVNTNEGTIIKAGYYWFGVWGRDTCISLPGLTLLNGDVKTFQSVVNTLLRGLKDGLLPNAVINGHPTYNTADASLWLIWALQQYAQRYHARIAVWKEYGAAMQSILHHYRLGASFGIRMEEDGLIYAGEEGYALTWMDAVVNNRPVTPRAGKAVEINALWYNAVCFCLELATLAGDKYFIANWSEWPEKICLSFLQCFWNPVEQCLFDYVNGAFKDAAVRPNQLLAVSLPYSPLTPYMQQAVTDKVRKDLLTPRGLRTLSPKDDQYHGHFGGDQATRDHAYHQGIVWPWMLAHFAAAYLRVYKYEALPLLQELYKGMAHALDEYCLYSIAEVFDSDAPYKAGGAVAQAWSVAELLRMNDLIHHFHIPVQEEIIRKK